MSRNHALLQLKEKNVYSKPTRSSQSVRLFTVADVNGDRPGQFTEAQSQSANVGEFSGEFLAEGVVGGHDVFDHSALLLSRQSNAKLGTGANVGHGHGAAGEGAIYFSSQG